MPGKILLMDGNSIINRAFYAIPLLTNKAGDFTNGVYGFLNIFFKLFDEEKPDYVAVSFDLPKPTFRHAQFEAYKGNRKSMPDELRPQLLLLKGLLGKMNIQIFEQEGYEADDMLGALAKKASQAGLDTVIVSGDRDLLQLCTDTVKVRIPKTKAGKTEIEDYDAQAVLEKIGVTPTEYIDMKALMGDASDNIPGVPGIGEKTALKIIQAYKNIETAIANADAVKPAKASENLMKFRDQALLSKSLATIFCDVPVELDLEALRTADMFNKAAFEEITRLEFKSLVPRFATFDKPQSHDVGAPTDPATIQPFLNMLMSKEMAAFQFHFHNDRMTDVSLAYETGSSLSLPIHAQLDEPELFRLIAPFLQSPQRKVTYDYKKAALYAHKFGITIQNVVFDTMLAAYILDTASGREQNAPAEADALLNDYVDMDARLTRNDQRFLYDNIEHPLVDVLLSMELHGIKVNKDELAAFGKKLNAQLDVLTADIYNLAGGPFNINSPQQLGIILFEKLGLKGTKKTKSGYSTAVDVLEKLYFKHGIIPKIMEYRTLSKLKSTYVDGLLGQIDAKTGKIYTTFNQTAASTGRISSEKPNLQNIPIRQALGRQLRKAFVPENSDYVFLDGDYSQIELRVLAHMAGDETLINAFKNGQDIHRLTASQVFNTPFDEVTAEQRGNAKAVNFGIVYGIGAFSLSEGLHITRKEAESYIEGYFTKYPKVKAYLDETVEKAHQNGYAATIFNRRRDIHELNSQSFNARAFGERVAMNMPVQGTAADIIKIAMINVHKRLKAEGLHAAIVLQVHDELLLEVRKDEVETVKRLLKTEMENCVPLLVPLETDCHVGGNWYDAK